MSRFDIADDDQAYDQLPEVKLWGAALALYIADAMDYASEKSRTTEARKVYRDITTDGLMLRYLCDRAFRDAGKIRGLFRQYLRKLVQNNPPKQQGTNKGQAITK